MHGPFGILVEVQLVHTRGAGPRLSVGVSFTPGHAVSLVMFGYVVLVLKALPARYSRLILA